MLLLRNFCVVCTLMLVAACGFQAVHAKRDASHGISPVLESIKVITPTNMEIDEQFLITELKDVLNPYSRNSETLYTLDVKATSDRQNQVIERNREITRYRVATNVRYELKDATTGDVVYKNNARLNESFEASTGSDYATYVAEEDARRRSMKEAANVIRIQLYNFLSK